MSIADPITKGIAQHPEVYLEGFVDALEYERARVGISELDAPAIRELIDLEALLSRKGRKLGIESRCYNHTAGQLRGIIGRAKFRHRQKLKATQCGDDDSSVDDHDSVLKTVEMEGVRALAWFEPEISDSATVSREEIEPQIFKIKAYIKLLRGLLHNARELGK